MKTHYPRLSVRARYDLGLVRSEFCGVAFCCGKRGSHAIFVPGVWWDVEGGEG